MPLNKETNQPTILDCNIIVSEFKLPLHDYICFWTNTLENSINSIIP